MIHQWFEFGYFSFELSGNEMSKLNSSDYDVVVLGVGSMGSAACWFLAAGGHRMRICHP